MGRIRRDHVRISGRIDDKSAEILAKVLHRIEYGRKIPMGDILSKLIRWTDAETWQRIIKTYPPKRWTGDKEDILRRSVEIKMEEWQREERRRNQS